eukprot:TRINITY_DN18004_c0_g1_i1.p1 TRINITY_DN18004_c0_g1~~TRINITY_DN18004_c0_g1_i1.p1  ORF type:complete len:194 (-),score=37.31 TRINITY_DN18004_c0_g1_i1:172-753(-)
MGEENATKTPGDVLGRVSEYVAGRGTHVRGDYICASIVGQQSISAPAAGASTEAQLPVIEVVNGKERSAVPETGSTVTAKVVRIDHRKATADILCVGPRAVTQKFTGIIRQQDVRATEIDKVEIATSFRPGDIVRAEVLSLGDARAYYLSTAKNELGVVFAKSPAGVRMLPVSWEKMQCPKTKVVELRKVAKT